MERTVQSIINDAAADLGDPAKGRVSELRWLAYYNDATEKISLGWKVMEQDATHDLMADEDRYTYPEDCVQMKSWRYSGTPSDITTFTYAHEYFEDEFRGRTNRSLPTGDDRFAYWARANFFQLTPRPITTVVDAGLITYWRLAAVVTDPAVLSDLPATMRIFVKDRMLISARRTLQRNDEWRVDYALWKEQIDEVYDRIEDRSDDRREQIRPASAERGYRGMR